MKNVINKPSLLGVTPALAVGEGCHALPHFTARGSKRGRLRRNVNTAARMTTRGGTC